MCPWVLDEESPDFRSVTLPGVAAPGRDVQTIARLSLTFDCRSLSPTISVRQEEAARQGRRRQGAPSAPEAVENPLHPAFDLVSQPAPCRRCHVDRQAWILQCAADGS